MATIEAGLFEAAVPSWWHRHSPPQRIGEHILIAWNCSTEQAELPRSRCRTAKSGSRDCADGRERNRAGPTGEHSPQYLERNGVSSEPITITPKGRSTTGETILAHAASLGLRPADHRCLHAEPVCVR